MFGDPSNDTNPRIGPAADQGREEGSRALWYPACERVELSVRDLATGAGFQLEVASGDAIDAFYHPYAYAAGHDSQDRVGGRASR